MDVCEQCGSASRDKSGICAGCGAPWPLAVPAVPVSQSKGSDPSPYAKLPEQISMLGFDDRGPMQVGTKNVGLAVALSLVLGPIGLLYCTVGGTVVMVIVSIVLRFFFGNASLLIVPPICAVWAWYAARDCSSPFD